jgi:hypothetical protein
MLKSRFLLFILFVFSSSSYLIADQEQQAQNTQQVKKIERQQKKMEEPRSKKVRRAMLKNTKQKSEKGKRTRQKTDYKTLKSTLPKF